MLKAKLKACLIHFSLTVVVAILTAVLVYGEWYPGAFAQMLSGTNLYLILLGVELCLGPLMSLVIYNVSKPRSELIRDYLFVGLVQLAALAFGLYSVALSRPVYLVFVKDRIEIIAATELKKDDLSQAKEDSFKHLSWFGPQSICTESPTDLKERSDLLLSSVSGKDIQLMPKYYRHCHENEVIEKALSKHVLFNTPKIKLTDLPMEYQSVDFKWLPVVTRFNAWIVIYLDGDINRPVYLNLNPF
jgi:hypothetical protein